MDGTQKHCQELPKRSALPMATTLTNVVNGKEYSMSKIQETGGEAKRALTIQQGCKAAGEPLSYLCKVVDKCFSLNTRTKQNDIKVSHHAKAFDCKGIDLQDDDYHPFQRRFMS